MRLETQVDPWAIPRELSRLGRAWVRHGVLGFPLKFTKALLQDPGIDGPGHESRFLDLFGEYILELFDALGPVYGKAGQIMLSRLSPDLHDVAKRLRLTRLYKEWPPLSFAEVKHILDKEIPQWRGQLEVRSTPIGVASMAQVHQAIGPDGEALAVKIIKPEAKKRMLETASALEQVVLVAEPMALTLTSQRAVKELKELIIGLRREVDLNRERATIERARTHLAKRRSRILAIPEVYEEFSSETVLTMELFEGHSFSDIVEETIKLPAKVRQKLAKKILSELLVQVFEWGLFHADPHAGNLILLEDGTVGLFDWGLAGELIDSDREHIAAILKSVLALDQEGLVDALIAMAATDGTMVSRSAVKKELKSLITLFKKGQTEGGKKPSLQQMFEACLKAAERLKIAVPPGLLLMVKSLITIEGLAKGIDPKVSMGRIATPVLLRAARPGVKDFFEMGKKLPQLTRMFFQ